MTGAVHGVRGVYRRMPEEVRRCLRPLNLVDELASVLPAAVRAPLATSTEAARRLLALRRLRVPVRRVEGVAAGGGPRLRATLAMDAASAEYWRRVLFAPDAREELDGDVRATEVAPRAAREADGADVALWRLAWPLGRTVRGLVVPSHVPLWLDTARPFDAIVAGDPAGRSSRKDDARRVRKLGLSVRVSTDPAEHEAFRRDLYEPYTRARFGTTGQLIPPHVFRHARRQGWLLVLERDGRAVAGALLERWGRDHRILAFGVPSRGPVPAGLALEACYCHAIRFATERGWPRLGLGNVRPVTTDGVYRYKRKWGARLGWPTTWDGWLLVCRNTAAVRAALAAAPIVATERGRLVALAGAAPGDAAAAAGRADTRGLAEIRLFVADPADAAGLAAPWTPVRPVVSQG